MGPSFKCYAFKRQGGISETHSLSLEGYRLITFERYKGGDTRSFGGSPLLIKSEIRDGINVDSD